MALAQIDHVVIAVASLEQAIKDYSELGFTVTPGGEHTGGGTHNALVVFEDGAYFELIAFKKPSPGFRWWEKLQSDGERIVDFALLPTAIEQDIADAKSRGVELVGPRPLGRNRPDGVRLDWLLGNPVTGDLPFLCGDITPRNLRVPEGEARIHANGVTGIASLTVVVEDLATSAARYRGLLALPEDASPVINIPGVGIDTAIFPIGTAQIVLVTPTGDGPAASQLRERLSSRGEGPYAVALRTPNSAATRYLDLQLTHGAFLELVNS